MDGREGTHEGGEGREGVVGGERLGSVEVNFIEAPVPPYLKHCAAGGCMRVVLC